MGIACRITDCGVPGRSLSGTGHFGGRQQIVSLVVFMIANLSAHCERARSKQIDEANARTDDSREFTRTRKADCELRL